MLLLQTQQVQQLMEKLPLSIQLLQLLIKAHLQMELRLRLVLQIHRQAKMQLEQRLQLRHHKVKILDHQQLHRILQLNQRQLKTRQILQQVKQIPKQLLQLLLL